MFLRGGIWLLSAKEKEWARSIWRTSQIFWITWVQRTLLRPETGRLSVINGIWNRLPVLAVTELETTAPGNAATTQLNAGISAENQINCHIPISLFIIAFIEDPLSQRLRVCRIRIVTGVCQSELWLTGEIAGKGVPVHTVTNTGHGWVLCTQAIRVQVVRLTVRSAKSVKRLLHSSAHDIRSGVSQIHLVVRHSKIPANTIIQLTSEAG